MRVTAVNFLPSARRVPPEQAECHQGEPCHRDDRTDEGPAVAPVMKLPVT